MRRSSNSFDAALGTMDSQDVAVTCVVSLPSPGAVVGSSIVSDASTT
jgi:hypothetical protein